MNCLMIVESPVKAKTIAGYLENESDSWVVLPTGGHILNLPRNEHGIIHRGTRFDGKWVMERGKGKVVQAIAKEATRADKVYVVTDPDREGEKIAVDIIDRANLKSYVRMGLNEITKKNVLEALKQAHGQVDEKINEAQKARRLIDREVGYPISQLIRADFQRKEGGIVPRGVGRVISPALHILCEAEERIDNFTSEEYYQIVIEYLEAGEQFYALCKTKFLTSQHEQLQEMLGIAQSSQHIVADYKRKNTEHSPPPPLITSQMQHSAFYLYNFLPNETMKLAQALFELGYITYIRSDSYAISDGAVRDIIQLIYVEFGAEHTLNIKRDYPDPPRAQHGHEAIRPTSFVKEFFPKNIMDLWVQKNENIDQKGGKLTEKHLQLYTFIFYRTIATQMKNSIYNNTTTAIEANGLRFEAQANNVLFAGWELLGKKNVVGVEIDDWKDRDILLPHLAIGSSVVPMNIDTVERHTRRPDRYGVGRFITTLDHAGIARPSTLAGIISSLKNKGYIDIRNGMLYPTETGRVIDVWVCEYCDWLADHKNAKEFEDKLDLIEKGEIPNADELIFEYHKKVDALKNELGLQTFDKLQPSKKQVGYACKIAENQGVILSKDILTDSKKMSSFINQNKPKSLGRCPSCKKGTISERSEFYGCSDFQGGCKFILSKKSVMRFLKQFDIPHSDNGQAIIKAATTSKPLQFDDLQGKRKTFSAKIILKEDDKWGWQLGFSF